ncbi:hypothetical protein [Streptosporangium sp. NPDC002524]|uniref:hypothetical protein n=1 Tax=Streptosporangium sp. NPDC002524 TaxID=3154537 RepID=UPI003332267A
MITSWIAYRQLMDIIRNYRSDGFEPVEINPDSGVDAAFVKENSVVYVQIKTRRPEFSHNQPSFDLAPQIAASLNNNEARLDVLWLPQVRLTSIEEVAAKISESRILSSGYPEPAFLLCFAATEAALFRMTYSLAPLPGDFSLGAAIYALRDHILIEESDFAYLTRASSIRNSLAHGRFSEVEITTQDVEALADIATKLNGSVTSQAVELLDEVLSRTRTPVDSSSHFMEQILVNIDKRYAEGIISRATEIIRNLASPA